MGDGIEDGLSLQSAICPHLHQFSSQVAFCLRVLTLFRDKQLCCPCFLQRSIENCREDPSAAALNSVLSPPFCPPLEHAWRDVMVTWRTALTIVHEGG